LRATEVTYVPRPPEGSEEAAADGAGAPAAEGAGEPG